MSFYNRSLSFVASLGLALMGSVVAAPASLGISDHTHMMGAAYPDAPPLNGRSSKHRSFGSTPGGRAHRRWRLARSSGIKGAFRG